MSSDAGIAMSMEQRIAKGERLVPAYRDKYDKVAVNIGDDYAFNWETYMVIEICQDELEGYCWIARQE